MNTVLDILDPLVRTVDETHPAVRAKFLLLRIATLSPSALLIGEVDLNGKLFKERFLWLYNPAIIEEEVSLNPQTGQRSTNMNIKSYPGLENNIMLIEIFGYTGIGILGEPFRSMYRHMAEEFYGVKLVTPLPHPPVP